ncbi:YgaP family membrane protein [Dongia sp. agr-C8]
MVSTARRVPKHTSSDVNARIRHDMIERIHHYADHPDEIPQRLAELDREWDIERAIEANASTLALTGVVLGATGDRRWLVLPALVTAFLLQHAVQGWCPPVPVLRRLRFRTADEINQERYALRALRGDLAGDGDGGPGRLKTVLKFVGLKS